VCIKYSVFCKVLQKHWLGEMGSTSVERRQWSAVSGAPSMERELIERCVGRAPSVER